MNSVVELPTASWRCSELCIRRAQRAVHPVSGHVPLTTVFLQVKTCPAVVNCPCVADTACSMSPCGCIPLPACMPWLCHAILQHALLPPLQAVFAWVTVKPCLVMGWCSSMQSIDTMATACARCVTTLQAMMTAGSSRVRVCCCRDSMHPSTSYGHGPAPTAPRQSVTSRAKPKRTRRSTPLPATAGSAIAGLASWEDVTGKAAVAAAPASGVRVAPHWEEQMAREPVGKRRVLQRWVLVGVVA